MYHSNILIIDDEEQFRQLLARIITLEGFKVFQASSAGEGFRVLENENIQVLITDVKLPDMNGLQILEQVRQQYPLMEVIVITAYGTIHDGVQAMKAGAFDYITKGDNDDQIHVIVARAAEKTALRQRLETLEKRVGERYDFNNIMGESRAIVQTKEMARKVAKTDTTVLLIGESGTGKELFAQAIHQAGSRRDRPFVTINCSAFPAELLESELFGYRRGAFTGADRDKKGFFEEADGGTLFLDEIGEMPSNLQAKLLRVLEEKSFTKLGDTRSHQIDVRIISATNRDLKQDIQNVVFRSDLYYRLSAFEIIIPPLRVRVDDISLLINHFMEEFSRSMKKPVGRISADFLKYMQAYPWPGNIRELRNVMERSVILAETDELTPDLLPPEIQKQDNKTGLASVDDSRLAEVEKRHIERTLDQTGWDKAEASKILGIGLSTLYRKIKEYQIPEN